METLEEYQSQLPQSQLKNRVAKKIVTASLASLAVTPSENLDMVGDVGVVVIRTEPDDGVHDGNLPVMFVSPGIALFCYTEFAKHFPELERALVGSEMLRQPEVSAVFLAVSKQ